MFRRQVRPRRKSLANKGNSVHPSTKTLVRQGKCLTFAAKPSLMTAFPHRKKAPVNRSELVDVVAEAAGLEKRQAEAAVSAVLDTVMSEARGGNKVSLFGFGTFTPTSRAARTGRNPQTGAPVKIAASKGVRFAPASAFKAALNPKAAGKKAAASAKASPAKKGAAAGKKAAPATKATKATKTAKKR